MNSWLFVITGLLKIFIIAIDRAVEKDEAKKQKKDNIFNEAKEAIKNKDKSHLVRVLNDYKRLRKS